MQEGEHMHESAPHHESSESSETDMSGEHARSSGHEDGGHQMSGAHQDLVPGGMLRNGVRTIDVKARKFEFDPAMIVVKQGEKVRLKVTSEDVMHGIGITDYSIDRKLPPGETQVVEFTADKPGRHHFHCSVYCGDGHGDMHGELVVLAE
jgi:nitrous oxide reductase